MKKYAGTRKYRTRGSTKKKASVKEAYKKDRFIRYKRKRGPFKSLSVLECVLFVLLFLTLSYTSYTYVAAKYPGVIAITIKYIQSYGFF